jgi:hypothetical protein
MAVFVHDGKKLYTDVDYSAIFNLVIEKYERDIHILDYTWYMNYIHEIVKDYVANNPVLSVSIVDDYGYMNSFREYENDGMDGIYFFDEENISKEALALYLIKRVFILAYAHRLEMFAYDEDILSDTDTVPMNSDYEDILSDTDTVPTDSDYEDF